MSSAAPSSGGSVDGIQFRNSASVGTAAGNRASDHMLKALLASVIPALRNDIINLWTDRLIVRVAKFVGPPLVLGPPTLRPSLRLPDRHEGGIKGVGWCCTCGLSR
jgi:hypothetical protein